MRYHSGMRILPALLLIAVLLSSCSGPAVRHDGAVLLADDGILEWLNVPAAIHHDGVTYFAYQAHGGGREGLDSVWVNSFEHETQQTGKWSCPVSVDTWKLGRCG